jgi:trans-2,3-dihydro-3-hydroxyanthranilate isomerase
VTYLDYHLLDVFTETPFAGNGLAVFVDPPPLTAAQMQALAREINLSETVFVSSHTFETRIFTPSVELPFAGHPTVGTAVLLYELGLVTETITLREGVGDVVCELDGNRATFTSARLPEPFDVPEPRVLAAAVGVQEDDLHPDFVPCGYSCGVPFAFVPVRDVDVVARSRATNAELGLQLYVTAPLDASFAHWHARMYATEFGIAEDPATGSAAAAFAGLLAGLDLEEVQIDQGVEMGRPSRLYVNLTRDAQGRLTAVRVGGDAVVVGGGRLLMP